MPGNKQPSVHRIGFTQLSSGDPVQTRQPKVKGHPQTTWENAKEDATSSKPKSFKKLFRPKPSESTRADEDTDKDPDKVFWPRDYLLEDEPAAEVWTYGYDADVISGLFKAGNKNSVSQHGRDLAVKLDREIKNQASPHP
ncbi:putative nb-arc and ankyrin domain protein [Eutypa lata UCREL1]|uniref:Putative nb-arc and ankyrin domain protein n=1 Tax=Eutypa lata (strain UCR-EL1) TaxID=1287681 RepID=M7TIT5_EUTLA|nr:putative nb-arc and ankyrin domain protein [Eutypa lata UCREL1]